MVEIDGRQVPGSEAGLLVLSDVLAILDPAGGVLCNVPVAELLVQASLLPCMEAVEQDPNLGVEVLLATIGTPQRVASLVNLAQLPACKDALTQLVCHPAGIRALLSPAIIQKILWKLGRALRQDGARFIEQYRPRACGALIDGDNGAKVSHNVLVP